MLDHQRAAGTAGSDSIGTNVPSGMGRLNRMPFSPAVSSNRSNGPHLLDPLPEDQLVGVVDPVTGEIIGAAG